jgi:diguanylate cyclase (GGDEF)-like protein
MEKHTISVSGDTHNPSATTQPSKTLKGFLLMAALGVSTLLFLLGYFIIASAYQSLVREDAQKVSELIAQQTFNSMYQVMSRGWSRQDVEGFLQSLRETTSETGYKIEIYRGPRVEDLFGAIGQPPLDRDIRTVFNGGERLQTHGDTTHRDLFPLKAEERCLKCHVNAKSGEVLGVIELSQDFTSMLERAQSKFMRILLLIAPLPILAAFLVALYITREIERPIEKLRSYVTNMGSLSDLRDLKHEMPMLKFRELDNLRVGVSELAEQLRHIAVDKDLLEFEIRLLERFVITSDVVRDWQEYVKRLLVEINHVIPSYTLYSVFKVGDETLDLEIFWTAPPDDRTKQEFEDQATRVIQESGRFKDVTFDTIYHHISDPAAPPVTFVPDDLEMQSKTLVVERPKIGGIVGVGLHSSMEHDPMRSLVVDSVLSTLLNVVGSVKAISKYTRELEYYATRDPLTNLYNQRVFRELLEYEISRAGRHGHRFALLVIDLDNFKAINDTHGHQEGDRFLQSFASTIKNVLRTGDVFSRYGGDEFVIMISEIEDSDPYVSAKRVLEACDTVVTTTPQGDEVRATSSIGVAVYPEHAENGNDLFMFADHMMYKAKSEGKHRLAIPDEADVLETFREIGIKSNLVQQALDEDWLIPYFQPIVVSEGGKPFAHEVLSRVQKPDGTIISAGEFVEVAERMGIIHRMDMMVMEKAFKCYTDTGYEGLLFINLSPKALVLKEFFENISHLMKRYPVQPEKIVFELTERDTVRNIGLLEKFVTRLHLEGFKFAIDDFGSGFSSFHYLKRFPVDYVKIEGDFIANITSDPRDLAFVQSISMLAHDLDMQTIGEYVEDQEVLEAVVSAGIDFAQGYHIGRPSPELGGS